MEYNCEGCERNENSDLDHDCDYCDTGYDTPGVKPSHWLAKKGFKLILDGPPGPEAGRFVEIENLQGESINAGEWKENGKFWELIVE